MAILRLSTNGVTWNIEIPVEDPTLSLLLSGLRAMTGNLDMGGNAIVSVGNVDGRDVSADGSTLDAHVADISDPHGAVMTVTTEVITPQIRATTSDLTLDVRDPFDDRTVQILNAAPGGKKANLNVADDITLGGRVDGRDVAADGVVLDTAVTAALTITDNAVIVGDGGSRGAQQRGVLINDSDVMSGITQLNVDNIRLDLHTISNTFTNASLVLQSNGTATTTVLKAGTVKANTDLLQLENAGAAADMDGTETSLLFQQEHNSGGSVDAGRVTVGTETDWTSTLSTQDSYMALHTASGGTVAEKVRITSGGIVGINTTTPGSIISNNQLDIRQDGERAAFALYTFHNTTANRGSVCYGGRARGTEGTPLIVQDGDRIFSFIAVGYDGAAWRTRANIFFDIDGTPASNSVPISISFRTGASAAVERFKIQADGDLLVDSGTSMFIRDSALGFNSSADGQLDLFADTELEITAPTVDLTASTAVIVRNVHGINYAPGSDVDADLITVDVTGAPRQWWDESENAFAMTHRLILPEGVQTKYSTDDVADPPTDAQLDTAFGDPTVVGSGFVGVLDDADGGTNCYICWTTGTAGEWFFVKGTKAA